MWYVQPRVIQLSEHAELNHATGSFITFPFIHRANSPEEATFLTEREKAYVKACLAQDAGYQQTSGEATKLNVKEWKAVFQDWQTYSWTVQYVRH